MVTFNTKKTDQDVVSRKRDRALSLPPVYLTDQPLSISKSFHQLGLRVSSKLYWNEHITLLAKKASQKLSFLYRSLKYFSSKQILLLYKTMIRPQLEYCSHVWGGAASVSTLSILDRIQKKAIRLINNEELCKSLQPLEHRRRVAALTIFYHNLKTP